MSAKGNAPENKKVSRKNKLFKDLLVGDSFIFKDTLHTKCCQRTALNKEKGLVAVRIPFKELTVVTKVNIFDAVMISKYGVYWNERTNQV